MSDKIDRTAMNRGMLYSGLFCLFMIILVVPL